MEDLKDREVALAVLILDACRDNPFTFDTKTLGGVGGLVPPGTRLGRFVFYAASAHETALTDHPGSAAEGGSVFTRVFLEQFDAYRHRQLRDFASALKRPVALLADPHPQHPTYEDGLDDSWCFDGCDTGPPSLGVLVRDQRIASAASTFEATAIVNQSRPEPPSAPARPERPPGPQDSAQNAIFLGKVSSLPAQGQSCLNKVTDSMPFGCKFLQRIADTETVGGAATTICTWHYAPTPT